VIAGDDDEFVSDEKACALPLAKDATATDADADASAAADDEEDDDMPSIPSVVSVVGAAVVASAAAD
jgi:hypothetical protein